MKQDYFFTDSQIQQIRDGALAILSEIGVKFGKQEYIDALNEKGFHSDGNFVRVEKQDALKKIESQKGSSRPPVMPLVTYISSYSHTYEDVDGGFSQITNQSNVSMGHFAGNVAAFYPALIPSCPGHPVDCHPNLQFLSHTVNSFIWCEDYNPMEPVSLSSAAYHFELCEIMGKSITNIPVYVASPLSVGGEGLEIAMTFPKKLEKIHVCSMPSLGANTPLNIVAAYAQTIAETVGGAVLIEALTGISTTYSTNIFPFDFYDISMPFGTPEKILLEWANMEVAGRVGGGRYMGPWSGDIHTNAPRCGIQACMEKAILASAAAMMGAKHFYCSGTLGMDELFSPVQLLLDLEMLTQIQRIIDGLPYDNFEGDLIEEIRDGINNGYVMSDRTLNNINNYCSMPGLLTRKSFGEYMEKPFPLELEKARAKAKKIMLMPPIWKLDDGLEREVLRIYEKAVASHA